MKDSLFDLAPESIPSNFKFNGPEFRPEHDQARLTGQCLRVRDLMLDGVWRTVQQIAFLTNDPEPSISAQLRALRKPRFGSYVVERRARGDRSSGLFEYKVSLPDPNAPKRETCFSMRQTLEELREENARLRAWIARVTP